MDKVKLYLELVRKHHFWALCGLSAVVGLMAWYMASGKLRAQFQRDCQTIDGTFSSLKNVAPDQPRGDWAEGLNKETAAVGQDIGNAWKTLYQEQKDKVFVWPKNLSPDFLEAANQLSDPNYVMRRRLAEYYQSMVKEQVNQLADIVDAASLAQMAQNGVGGADAQNHRVDWSQSSQQDIQQTFDWTARPSTLLIKYAQEELWVYQALCNVIKTANEGSAARHDAVVQEIDVMDIAYAAVEDSPGGAGQNHVESIGTAAAASPAAPVGVGAPGANANTRPDPKMRGKSEGQSRGLSFSQPGGGEAAAAGNPDDQWKNFRYVNSDGTPKMAADVDANAGEYNLMPFHLLLKMDSRYVDHLLVAFRNSVLPFEVQQVRINPEHAGNSGASYSHFVPRGGPEGEHGPAAGPGGRGPGAMANSSAQQHDRTVTVEIRGVAYLIKPPDLAKLHIAPATETPAADTAATAGTSAAAPATAPVPVAAPAAGNNVEAGAVGGVIKEVGNTPAAGAGAGATTVATPPAGAPETPPAAAVTPAAAGTAPATQ